MQFVCLWTNDIVAFKCSTAAFLVFVSLVGELASTFYTFDERGNVAQRTDGTGAVLSTDLYDAYGKLLSGGAAGDPWGFEAQSGYYTDSETGLILCTHRYYDPNTGRFLTRDPLGYDGGIDLYGYVGNDPVNFIDPFGYDAWALGLRLALGAEALGGGPEDPAADVVAGVILGVAGGVVLYDHLTHKPQTSEARGSNLPRRKELPARDGDAQPKPRRIFRRCPTRSRAEKQAEESGNGPPEHDKPKINENGEYEPGHYHPTRPDGKGGYVRIPDGVHWQYPPFK